MLWDCITSFYVPWKISGKSVVSTGIYMLDIMFKIKLDILSTILIRFNQKEKNKWNLIYRIYPCSNITINKLFTIGIDPLELRWQLLMILSSQSRKLAKDYQIINTCCKFFISTFHQIAFAILVHDNNTHGLILVICYLIHAW